MPPDTAAASSAPLSTRKGGAPSSGSPPPVATPPTGFTFTWPPVVDFLVVVDFGAGWVFVVVDGCPAVGGDVFWGGRGGRVSQALPSLSAPSSPLGSDGSWS